MSAWYLADALVVPYTNNELAITMENTKERIANIESGIHIQSSLPNQFLLKFQQNQTLSLQRPA